MVHFFLRENTNTKRVNISFHSQPFVTSMAVPHCACAVNAELLSDRSRKLEHSLVCPVLDDFSQVWARYVSGGELVIEQERAASVGVELVTNPASNTTAKW